MWWLGSPQHYRLSARSVLTTLKPVPVNTDPTINRS
jgi:hypothetical protein